MRNLYSMLPSKLDVVKPDTPDVYTDYDAWEKEVETRFGDAFESWPPRGTEILVSNLEGLVIAIWDMHKNEGRFTTP